MLMCITVLLERGCSPHLDIRRFFLQGGHFQQSWPSQGVKVKSNHVLKCQDLMLVDFGYQKC